MVSLHQDPDYLVAAAACLPACVVHNQPPQVSKWLASDEYLVLDGPLRSMANPGDAGWSLQGGGSSYNAPAAYGYGSYDDARGFNDGQRGRNTASPCFGPSGSSYRFRSSQQKQRQFGGNNYGRSRSMDVEGCYAAFGRSEQQRWQQQRQYQDFRDRGGSMEWEDDEGYGVEEEEGPWCDDDEGEAGGWCDGDAALLEERRLEDMESLLGRILLHRWGAVGCWWGWSGHRVVGAAGVRL
jgi:hypothetical protein